MDHGTVMVNLTPEQSNDGCLAVAGRLVEKFKASIIGIAACEYSPPPYFVEGKAAQQLLDREQAAVTKKLAALEAEFLGCMQGRSHDISWRSAIDMPLKYITREVRAADILVIGTHPGGAPDPFAAADASDLVMQVGRPLLIVPDTVRGSDMHRALIAWKDTPEARRAVVQALPLLKAAKDVTIAEILEDSRKQADAKTAVEDVAAWLSRHGVAAATMVVEDTTDVAGQIDSIATNIDAEIIIGGAYGHSRFREWVLGGVTRHFIMQSSRCALLCH